MHHNEFGVPPEHPYRQSAGPRQVAAAREISVGFVISFVVFLVVLTKALSAEAWPDQSFGRLGAWYSGQSHARAAVHHR